MPPHYFPKMAPSLTTSLLLGILCGSPCNWYSFLEIQVCHCVRQGVWDHWSRGSKQQSQYSQWPRSSILLFTTTQGQFTTTCHVQNTKQVFAMLQQVCFLCRQPSSGAHPSWSEVSCTFWISPMMMADTLYQIGLVMWMGMLSRSCGVSSSLYHCIRSTFCWSAPCWNGNGLMLWVRILCSKGFYYFVSRREILFKWYLETTVVSRIMVAVPMEMVREWRSRDALCMQRTTIIKMSFTLNLTTLNNNKATMTMTPSNINNNNNPHHIHFNCTV